MAKPTLLDQMTNFRLGFNYWFSVPEIDTWSYVIRLCYDHLSDIGEYWVWSGDTFFFKKKEDMQMIQGLMLMVK